MSRNLREINRIKRWHLEFEHIMDKYEYECGECRARKMTEGDLQYINSKLKKHEMKV